MSLGAPPRDWSRVSLIEKASFDSIDEKDRKEAEAKRVMGTRPSLPLERYTGTYADSLYGSVVIRMENGHLVLDMAPKMTGAIEHWHYDTFRVVWRDRRDGTNLLTFTLDADGKIDVMTADVGGPAEETPRMKRVSDSTIRTSSTMK